MMIGRLGDDLSVLGRYLVEEGSLQGVLKVVFSLQHSAQRQQALSRYRSGELFFGVGLAEIASRP